MRTSLFKKNQRPLPFGLIVILAFVFFSLFVFRSYFFKGYVPFPANLLVQFYSPWRHYQWEGYPYGPPTKPIGFDDLRLFYPFRKFTLEQFKKGSWPLWNPYAFSGNVHLATYQAAVLYPLNFVYFILPQIDAWSLLVVLQPILIGFFTYLFLKEINLSKKAAFFGAFVFAFSGWMLVWMEEDLVKEHSALWLPLILYALERFDKKISIRNIVLLVFAITCSVLAGFLQLTIYVFIAVLAWIAFIYWGFNKRNLKKLGTLIICFVFAFLFSAPHVLPAIQAYFISPRGLVDVRFLFEEYLAQPSHLITLLAPDFWGNPGAFNYFGNGFYHEKMIYFGIPALLFSLYALGLKHRNKRLKFFKWFSLASLSLGFYPLGWFLYFSQLPLFSTMIPSRIFFLPTFGFCVLAAFGLDYYLKTKIRWKNWLVIFIGLTAIFVLLWCFVLSQRAIRPQENYATISFRNLLLPTAFFFASFLIIFFPKIKKIFPFLDRLSLAKVKILVFIGVFSLSVFSSFYFANKYLYFSERKFVFPQVPVISKLKEISGMNRIWGYGNAYWERNMSTYYGLYMPGGYDALFSQRYGELLYAGETEGKITNQIPRCDAKIRQASEREGLLENWYRARLLSLLGVRYIIEAKTGEGKDWRTQEERFPGHSFQFIWEDEKFRIWEYKKALPRVFLVNDYLVEKDRQKIADYIFDRDFNLEKVIVLEEEPGIKISPWDKAEKREVEVVEYTPSKVVLKTKLPVSTLLFLSDNYYPGWRAHIDGKTSKILRANYSFKSVAVPAGEHEIVFFYKPKVFYWSLKISIFSLLLFIVFLMFFKTKKEDGKN